MRNINIVPGGGNMIFSHIDYPSKYFDEIYDFEMWAKDYYLSLNEEFTMYQIDGYIQKEGVILESSFTNIVSKIINKIISFIKECWNRVTRIFKRNISKVKSTLNDNKSKDFTITNAFYEAVNSANLRMVRIMMKDSLLVDPTFKQFSEMDSIASKKLKNLYEKHDGRELNMDKASWNTDYMDTLMVQVVSNFSRERVEHLKKVVSYVLANEKHVEAYNYMMILKSVQFDRISDICTKLYNNAVHIVDGELNSGMYLILKKYESSPSKMADFAFSEIQKSNQEVLDMFNVDEISRISPEMIRRYIFKNTKKKVISIDKESISDNISKITNVYLDDITETHSFFEKNLNTIIKKLKQLKSDIERNKDKIDDFKSANHDDYRKIDDEVQSAVLKFLKLIQKEVADILNFTSKAINVQLGLINEAIEFYNSLL